MLANKKFRELREEYMKHQELSLRSSEAIPKFENALIPARHHLAVLRLMEDELRPLDNKINLFDIQEQVEKDIVEEHKQFVKSRRDTAAAERIKKEKERMEMELEIQRKKDEEKERELKKKRAHLMDLLRSEIHEVCFQIVLKLD